MCQNFEMLKFNFEKYSKTLKLAILIQSTKRHKAITMLMCEIKENKMWKLTA